MRTHSAAPTAPAADDATVALYTMAKAAELVAVPANTFRNWALGYTYPGRAGAPARSSSLIHLAAPPGAGRPTVPFIGLAEGYMLSAFTKAGVPMQRIRPAIEWLRENLGLDNVLASERLYTDGAEVLYDYGRRSDDPADAEAVDMLVVARNQQGVYRPVIEKHLKAVTYRNGFANLIHLPGYRRADVVVSPGINYGEPTLSRGRIRVDDVLNRIAAGEPPRQVAEDYRLDPADVDDLVRHRARQAA